MPRATLPKQDGARRLNSKERERIERIRSRCEFLRGRISVSPEGSTRHWRDTAELSALVWVVDAVEALVAGTYQPPPADERRGVPRVRPTALERWERREAEKAEVTR